MQQLDEQMHFLLSEALPILIDDTETSYHKSLRGIRVDYSLDLLPMYNDINRFNILYNDLAQQVSSVGIQARIRSVQSVQLKVARYNNAHRDINSVFNDLVAFRILIPTFDNYSDMYFKDQFYRSNVYDGQRNGYRGIHYYYKLDNLHYQAEVAVNTYADRQFSNLLHRYVYKQYPDIVGQKMFAHYQNNDIINEQTFLEVLQWTLLQL